MNKETNRPLYARSSFQQQQQRPLFFSYFLSSPHRLSAGKYSTIICDLVSLAIVQISNLPYLPKWPRMCALAIFRLVVRPILSASDTFGLLAPCIWHSDCVVRVEFVVKLFHIFDTTFVFIFFFVAFASFCLIGFGFFFCFPFSKLSFDQTYQNCNFVLYVDDRMSHGYGLGLPCSYRPAAHCFLAKYYWCGRYASTTTGRPSAEALALAFLDSNS